MNNKVQLITYPDSLGNNLKDLYFVLNKYLKGKIGGVHILPIYPSSSDRGFAPLTHLKVDSAFGTWRDVKRIASEYDLMLDFVMNHVSAKSEYFLNFLKYGYRSKYSDLFVTSDKVFGDKVLPEDLLKIYLPRNTDPFMLIELPKGLKKNIWVTFSSDQIDLDWNSEVTKKLMKSFLLNLMENGVKYLRLDAAGFTLKKAGTSCFFSDGDVYKNIFWVKDIVGKDIFLLPEVHSKYTVQTEIASKCDLAYDFQLTILILYGIYFGEVKKLKNWLKIRPNNLITVLDTHDGIGIVDIVDLLNEKEIKLVKDKLYDYGGNDTLRASGTNSNNVDIYQINCTYFSALNSDENAYILSRVVQFFVPGIPQVYYVGLFTGKNDCALLKKTGIGRDINRHYYSLDEIEKKMKKNVVKRLMNLMEFRNNYPAFNGKFELNKSNDFSLDLSWKNGEYETKLKANFKEKFFLIEYVDLEDGQAVWKKLVGV
ncbi:MAG: sucrose phosphorylase [Nanoarchaeota archaeon]|nr:sucrose phosphorylase [Nanoarchaeota archaeon]